MHVQRSHTCVFFSYLYGSISHLYVFNLPVWLNHTCVFLLPVWLSHTCRFFLTCMTKSHLSVFLTCMAISHLLCITSAYLYGQVTPIQLRLSKLHSSLVFFDHSTNHCNCLPIFNRIYTRNTKK